MFRPFPRVPPFPLSNYNQIKDRVFVIRHHKRAWRNYTRHYIKTQNSAGFADFIYSKKIFSADAILYAKTAIECNESV